MFKSWKICLFRKKNLLQNYFSNPQFKPSKSPRFHGQLLIFEIDHFIPVNVINGGETFSKIKVEAAR